MRVNENIHGVTEFGLGIMRSLGWFGLEGKACRYLFVNSKRSFVYFSEK